LREIDVDRLARLLRNLEANWPPCFALSNGGSIDGITMGCHINNPQAYQVARLKFAVDGEVARSLKRFNNWSRVLTAQTCFGLRGGLAPVSLPLFQG